MGEHKVSISAELLKSVFGWEMLFTTLLDYLFQTIAPTFLAWIVVAVIDTANSQGTLIGQHGTGLAAAAFLLALYLTLRRYFHVTGKSMDLVVSADQQGMTAESFIPWSAFTHYRVYEHCYLLIKRSGNSMLIPNTGDLEDLLSLIRGQLPSSEEKNKADAAYSLREFLRKLRGFIVVAGLALAALLAIYFANIPSPAFDHAQLIDNPAQYLGKRLAVEPFHGLGWNNSNGEVVDVPAPLLIELQELVSRDGFVIGGIGKVLTPDHVLSDQWMEFSLRHREEASLAVKKAAYTMGFAPGRFTATNDDSATTAGATGIGYIGWGFIYAMPDATATATNDSGAR
jgi:hypothetical protein